MRLDAFQRRVKVCQARGLRFAHIRGAAVVGPLDYGDDPGLPVPSNGEPTLDVVLSPLAAEAQEMDATRLFAWASRRRGEAAACEDEPGGSCGCGSIWHPCDSQRIAGHVYNRALIREALQPLTEDWAPTVRVETLMSPSGPMLRIAWGEWLISVLAQVEGTEAGDDPLEIGGAP